MPIGAVDLFSGVGGLTRGLLNVGIFVRAGIDIDPACKYPYETNNNAVFVHEDISKVSPESVESFLDGFDLRLLAGCAPCQPFSPYGQTRQGQHKDWDLLNRFRDLVEAIQPELITMENVPQLEKHSIFDEFVSALRRLEYKVSYSVIEGPLYGIPQYRKRLVLFASKLGIVRIIPPTHDQNTCPKVRDVIAHLPPLRSGGVSAVDPLHRSSKLSEINLKRIQSSRPGGTWREWPPGLVAECHRQQSGKTYPGVYGRMEWDKPAPTITTQAYGFGNGRFGHPEQDRALSLREAALLQTFPEDYEFTGPDQPVVMKTLGRLIGNAVPVRLGEVVGLTLLDHVRDVYGR